jgi:hypothetical protein
VVEKFATASRRRLRLGPMEKARCRDQARLGVGLARAQIPIIGENGSPLLVIDGERTLRHRMGKAIQRRIDSRYDEKKADDQEGESF